jgi:hypothetical protein
MPGESTLVTTSPSLNASKTEKQNILYDIVIPLNKRGNIG